jgi:hypothetical protein
MICAARAIHPGRKRGEPNPVGRSPLFPCLFHNVVNNSRQLTNLPVSCILASGAVRLTFNFITSYTSHWTSGPTFRDKVRGKPPSPWRWEIYPNIGSTAPTPAGSPYVSSIRSRGARASAVVRRRRPAICTLPESSEAVSAASLIFPISLCFAWMLVPLRLQLRKKPRRPARALNGPRWGAWG